MRHKAKPEVEMSKRCLVLTVLLLSAVSSHAAALVSLVRLKLSAGDLPSGIAAVQDYKRDTGVDGEYLNAVGWLARGAILLHRSDLATQYVAELHREIPEEKPDLIVPFGAAIEVESRLILDREGRGAALKYLHAAAAVAQDPALRSRINKNINLLSMEGSPAPQISAEMAGKPTVLFLWAQGCGDCRAQAAGLAHVWAKYRGKGVVMLAPTRYYGTVDEKPATPDEEKARVTKVWSESYKGLEDVPVLIDTDAHIAYGASATPTFVFIDRKGIVRAYLPTRLSEEEMSRRIDALLSD